MLNELEWIELKNKFFCTETEAETAPLVAPSDPYAAGKRIGSERPLKLRDSLDEFQTHQKDQKDLQLWRNMYWAALQTLFQLRQGLTYQVDRAMCKPAGC